MSTSPMFKDLLIVALKGAGMGAANVIPGVSGGTIAFITGIYERLLNALKSFGPEAAKQLLKRDFSGFAKTVDLPFLAALGIGVVVSIISLAKLLEHLFETHPTLVWAFFFGLIIASVPAVARMVKSWKAPQIVALLIGAAIAISFVFITPAAENDSFFYLMLCGVAAMCSMIIPGVSGSFVLLLMGNYPLVLRAINERDLLKLVPVGIGAVAGLIALSHLLSWLFKRYHDTATALVTGFVAGSLPTIWPWKVPGEIEMITVGEKTKEKILSYNYEIPDFAATSTWIAIGLLVLGAVLVIVLDRVGRARDVA